MEISENPTLTELLEVSGCITETWFVKAEMKNPVVRAGALAPQVSRESAFPKAA